MGIILIIASFTGKKTSIPHKFYIAIAISFGLWLVTISSHCIYKGYNEIYELRFLIVIISFSFLSQFAWCFAYLLIKEKNLKVTLSSINNIGKNFGQNILSNEVSDHISHNSN